MAKKCFMEGLLFCVLLQLFSDLYFCHVGLLIIADVMSESLTAGGTWEASWSSDEFFRKPSYMFAQV